MIQRRVVVPAGTQRLWRALTDPAEAGAWLGGSLDWTPEEGGSLRFVPGPGTAGSPMPPMDGRVEAVDPGRYLRFRWWPADVGPAAASEVAYLLEPASDCDPEGPDADGTSTLLTVEEAPVGAAASAGPVAGTDTAAGSSFLMSAAPSGEWTRLDSLCLSVWAVARHPAVALGR